jgi:phosphodiesterase/alkaline phosphatase D-like protein
MPMLRMPLVLASVLCSALVFSASASAIFKTAPEQIHTAFAGPDGLAVTWFTLNATATSTLKWGAASGQLDHTASGTAVSYGAEGLHHTVVVKGLAARTKYYYQCGDAAGGFSATQSVSTARAAGDATPFTVGIVGDMGTINGGPSTAGMIGRAAETEFTLHIGDISYADDTLEEFYEATWNDFMNRIQPLAANQAYMVLPGNHEGVLITLVLHAFSECPTTWFAS